MVGIPASGKSTYAKKLAEDTGAVIISSDGIRAELSGTEEYNEAQNYKVICTIRGRLRHLIKDHDVIIDATNVHVADWRDYIDRCPPDITVKVHWFEIPPEVAMQRMVGRERKVPEEVLRDKWNTMTTNKKYLEKYIKPENIVCITPDMH
jgi:predicted kinase